MAVSLKKGGSVSLKKRAPGLSKALMGLGWDERVSGGADFDLDAVCFLLKSNDKVGKDEDFIFYNNLNSACGSVSHAGDNRTGAGAGDDEVVYVEIGKIPADVQRIVFAVTIHDAEERRQNFGMVRNAFIRIVDDKTSKEIARYDLSEDYSTEASIVFGDLYRERSDWRFRAVGDGFYGGLETIAQNFGVNI